MTITLESIEAQHARIGEMIASFKAQPVATEYRIEAAVIPLAPGERLAGAVLNDDGSLKHYLIKLPGMARNVSWDAALKYAIESGGDAPDMQELALMFANLRGEFEGVCVWSKEVLEDDSAYARCQGFGFGGQTSYHKGDELCGVAVRRFIPSVI